MRVALEVGTCVLRFIFCPWENVGIEASALGKIRIMPCTVLPIYPLQQGQNMLQVGRNQLQKETNQLQ